MKIAIHHSKYSFSERWIEYCENNNIHYKLVNCYDSDIIEQLQDCDGLMWHWSHTDLKAMHFARQLTYSLVQIGKKVFPDTATVWHFDDKVGQKYLLEAIGAPLVPSWIFYDRKSAVNWVSKTEFPKVFKLKAGAGSRNVWKVSTKNEAINLINRAFGKGFLMTDPWLEVKDRYEKLIIQKNKYNLIRLFKGIGRLIIKSNKDSYKLIEKGYAYFQEFIPDNQFDLRVVTIGNRAFVLRRLVRPGDFRASGSGKIEYPGNEINTDLIKVSFDISTNVHAQCLAYDYVFDRSGKPYLVEISYAFSMLAYDHCKGYWNKDLIWNDKVVNAAIFMIEDFISDFPK